MQVPVPITAVLFKYRVPTTAPNAMDFYQRTGKRRANATRNISARRFWIAAICPKSTSIGKTAKVANAIARYSRREILVYLRGIAYLSQTYF